MDVWLCKPTTTAPNQRTKLSRLINYTACCTLLKLRFMATIYKVEIVSHWTNYTKEQLQKILEDAVKQKERDKGNTMTIEVTERK